MIDSFVDGMAEGLGRVADLLHDAGDKVNGWADAFSHWTFQGVGKTVEQMTPWDALDHFLTEAGISHQATRPVEATHSHWYSDPFAPENVERWLEHVDGDTENNDLDNLVIHERPRINPEIGRHQWHGSPTFDGFPIPGAGGPPEA